MVTECFRWTCTRERLRSLSFTRIFFWRKTTRRRQWGTEDSCDCRMLTERKTTLSFRLSILVKGAKCGAILILRTGETKRCRCRNIERITNKAFLCKQVPLDEWKQVMLILCGKGKKGTWFDQLRQASSTFMVTADGARTSTVGFSTTTQLSCVFSEATGYL